MGGGVVTTVLQYLVIAAVIGGIVFALAVFVFGRGEQMAALPARTSPTELPDEGMTGTDVRSVRFAMALRGYRMSDVDWALERIAAELDALRAQLADRTPVPVATVEQAADAMTDDLAERRAGTGQAPAGAAEQPDPTIPTPGDRE